MRVLDPEVQGREAAHRDADDVGALEAETVEQSKGEEAGLEPVVPDDPTADMRGDVHMLRNLALALATRR